MVDRTNGIAEYGMQSGYWITVTSGQGEGLGFTISNMTVEGYVRGSSGCCSK